MLGLFRRIKEPVEGTAQVVAATARIGDAATQGVHMNLAVQALGVEPFTLVHECEAPADRWPEPGAMLPVVFDRDHHERLKVLWDQVPAGAVAPRVDATAPPAAPVAPAGLVPPEAQGMVDQLQQMFPGAHIEVQSKSVDLTGDPQAGAVLGAVESALGQDLDGDGHIGPPTSSPSEDRVDALERLARLHDSGALTEEEFAAEKRRLLG